MMNYIDYLEHIGVKLLSILSTAWGWAVGLVLLLIDFIARFSRRFREQVYEITKKK